MESYSAFLDFIVNYFDPHGEMHAENVSNHASRLAGAAGLDPYEIQRIEIAARYHDIGKILVPESIRRFPGIYTPLEHQLMQKHCEMGAQLLQSLHFEPQVITIVLDHHENYDGSGYPMMLRDEQIPIGARIIRIVDSFDALTNNRGYRPACPQKRALEKMQAVSQHYDPELLPLFVEMIETKWTLPQSR